MQPYFFLLLLFSTFLFPMDAVTDPLEIMHCSLVTTQTVSPLLGNIVSFALHHGLRAAKKVQQVSMPLQTPIQSKELNHYLQEFKQYKYLDRNQQVLEKVIIKHESAVVKELLENPRMKSDINLSTALSLAIECNDIPCVSAILAHKPKFLQCQSKFLTMRYASLLPYEFAQDKPEIITLLDTRRVQEYQENVAVLQKAIHGNPYTIPPHVRIISEYAAEYQLFQENPLSPQKIASIIEKSCRKDTTPDDEDPGDKKSNEH